MANNVDVSCIGEHMLSSPQEICVCRIHRSFVNLRYRDVNGVWMTDNNV